MSFFVRGLVLVSGNHDSFNRPDTSGIQAMADRHTYLPSIGHAIIAGLGPSAFMPDQ